MAVNNFLPFAPTDTGTNLLSQADYAVAADRTIGNQPGVASSKLVNKSIRQSAYITSQLAQFLSDQTGADLLDDATPAKLLAQINAAIQPLAPIVTKYLSSSGNHNKSYVFFIASGNATVGATYTNNSVTYTVSATVAAGVKVTMTGNGDPTVSGTLTKASGTGDATLTFYAQRSAIYFRVRGVGGGGGGAGSGTHAATNTGSGGTGGTTSFGTTLLQALGGGGGVGGANASISAGGAGGTASLGTGPVGVNPAGNGGGSGSYSGTGGGYAKGAMGGGSAFFGGGANAAGAGNSGPSGATNTGGGGAGGGQIGGPTDTDMGGAGGGGGSFDALIFSPAATYAWAVGAAGTNGAAGTSGFAGGAGAAGLIEVIEFFQ